MRRLNLLEGGKGRSRVKGQELEKVKVKEKVKKSRK
jgi:hypothetical protein